MGALHGVADLLVRELHAGDQLEAVEALLPRVHEVDRNAVRVWFRFYPLDLVRFIAAAEDREETLLGFALKGDIELKNRIDTSHHFLYGHRHWKTVKAAQQGDVC